DDVAWRNSSRRNLRATGLGAVRTPLIRRRMHAPGSSVLWVEVPRRITLLTGCYCSCSGDFLFFVQFCQYFLCPRLGRHRESKTGPAIEIAGGDTTSEVTDATDICGAFGNGDGAARIKQIERVCG